MAWCHLNPESALLTNIIDGAVEVAGSEQAEAKEEKLAAFTRGEIRVLVTTEEGDIQGSRLRIKVMPQVELPPAPLSTPAKPIESVGGTKGDVKAVVKKTVAKKATTKVAK